MCFAMLTEILSSNDVFSLFEFQQLPKKSKLPYTI